MNRERRGGAPGGRPLGVKPKWESTTTCMGMETKSMRLEGKRVEKRSQREMIALTPDQEQ